MPTTSVLSARQPASVRRSVFAAPAATAIGASEDARSSAARFNGIVQENPTQSARCANTGQIVDTALDRVVRPVQAESGVGSAVHHRR